MNDKNMYKQFISEVIVTQSNIVGVSIAVLRARLVEGLVVDEKGNVVDITGDPNVIVTDLIASYSKISGELGKRTMKPILDKYPSLYNSNSL